MFACEKTDLLLFEERFLEKEQRTCCSDFDVVVDLRWTAEAINTGIEHGIIRHIERKSEVRGQGNVSGQVIGPDTRI